jgi:hypothetical protein
VTRPLNTSHGLDELPHPGNGLEARGREQGRRPRSAVSTVSNPGSEHHGPTLVQAVTPGIHDRSTTVGETSQQSSEPCDPTPALPPRQKGNEDGEAEAARTYLVEVINYPALQFAKERAHIYAKGEYDAVMLVYDVGNRQSFEEVVDLQAEIPMGRGLSSWRRTRRKSGSVRRTRSSIFGGGSGEANESSRRAGEPVVALVGNKSDFDAEYASVDLEKEAAREEAHVEERSLVHPLYRESRIYDDPPLSPRSARSMPSPNIFGYGNDRVGTIPEPLGASLEGDALVRRSTTSADAALLRGADARASILLSAKRSVRTVQEGKERALPRLPMREPAGTTEAIENWIETGSPTVATMAAKYEAATVEDGEDGVTRVDSLQASEATSASRRQVSRLEGELLARTLLLGVPFFEASAKTGENVEELFEAVIREVLGGTRGKEMESFTATISPGDLQTEAGSSGKDESYGIGGGTSRKGSKKSMTKKQKKEKASSHVIADQETEMAGQAPRLDPVVLDNGIGDIAEASETAAVGNIGMTEDTVINGPVPGAQRRRRGSVLDRFRRAFTKKTTGIAVTGVVG